MDNIRDIAVDLVVAGGLNLRKNFDSEHIRELAGSIKRDGLWNPIIVRGRSDGKYELIAGECRLRAVKRIGLVNIRARILRIDDEEAKLSKRYQFNLFHPKRVWFLYTRTRNQLMHFVLTKKWEVAGNITTCLGFEPPLGAISGS